MKQFLLSLCISGLLLQSCTEKKSEPDTGQHFADTIEFKDGWVRQGKSGMMSAAYFSIYNGTQYSDTLWSISAEKVSDDVQIHESYKTSDDLMGMRPVGAISVPAGETVELKPGGIHIMIIRPYTDLTEGDSVEFELNFSSGDTLITLPVKNGL